MEAEQIETYDDLLKMNLQFFDRKLDKTFYYDGKWAEEDGETHLPSTLTLIQLAKNDIFTFNGQSPSSVQRSYVEFFIPSEMVEKIYAYMESDIRIWVQFEWKNGQIWSSIDEYVKKIALTKNDKKKVCTEWHNGYDFHSRIGGTYLFPNIQSILSKMAYGIVICRDFGKNEKNEKSEDILFEYIRKLIK